MIVARQQRELEESYQREQWYRSQIESLQAKAGITREVRSGPYKSGIKPAVSPDFENYIQTRNLEELKKMDQELTEAITSAPAVIHND